MQLAERSVIDALCMISSQDISTSA